MTCENGACDPDSRAHVERSVEDIFDRCSSFIASHPAINKCTDRFRRFVPVWLAQHSRDSYGFRIPNHQYFLEQETPDKPAGMMLPPKAIMEALPYRSDVEAAARRAGLRYLTHDSALAGVRTFVLYSDPQGRYDQWLLLNLPNGQGKMVEEVEPMSVLTVQKKDASGHWLAHNHLHFRDYFIHPKKGGGYKYVLHDDSDGKCYACHANGVRQLIARRTPVLDALPVTGEPGYGSGKVDSKTFGFRRLMEFNRKLRTYGTADWDGKIHLADNGPSLGKAQGCMDCHDGVSRAALTVFFSAVQTNQKMVRELTMPPDTNLPLLLEHLQMSTPSATDKQVGVLASALEHQKKLFQEYEDSRLPLLKQWLLKVPCSTDLTLK